MKIKTINIRIENLAAGGDGMGRHQGKVCFVPRTAPGDHATIQVLQQTKGFLRGELQCLLESGPHRRPSPCPLFERCGGCPLSHLEEEAQRSAKQDILARALRVPLAPLTSGDASLGYRRLARLHYDPRTKSLGFMGEGEAGILDTPTCPVLMPKLNETLPLIVRDMLRLVPHRLEVWLGQGREGVALSISCDSPLPPAVYEAARDSVQGPLCTVVACIGGHWSAMAGSGTLRVTAADGRDMTLPAGSFGQANEEVNLLLGERIGEFLQSLGAKRGLELFSGAGNLTPVLAQHISGLECVELDSRAVAAARSNLSERDLTHIGVHQTDAFDGLRKFGKDRDIVILDPPRTGCIEVAQTLAATKPKWVLYVSCDPATLARDLRPLRQSGYSIVHAAGFDMFPQTPHLEAVVLLER